jgi:hypothetical protein
MKIPQSHIDNKNGGVQYTLKTPSDTFEIDGDKSQEIKEHHFGGVEAKKKLSTLQSYVTFGFMQMVAWVSSPSMASATYYQFMDQVNTFDAAELI